MEQVSSKVQNILKNTDEQYDQAVAKCREIFEKKTYDYGTAWRILRTSSITDQIFISNYEAVPEKQYRRLEVTSTGDVERGTKGVMNDKVTYTIGFKERTALLKRNFAE